MHFVCVWQCYWTGRSRESIITVIDFSKTREWKHCTLLHNVLAGRKRENTKIEFIDNNFAAVRVRSLWSYLFSPVFLLASWIHFFNFPIYFSSFGLQTEANIA